MLIALTTLPAAADDTELFIGTSNPLLTGVQPNILFIYDNSGSMDSDVLTQEPWNPNTDFVGCYNTNRLYFSTNSTPPGCNSQNYIDASVNYCQASVGLLNNVGTYTDEMQAWRAGNTKRWVDLSTTHSRPMECQNDAGTHGQTSGTYYAVNGNNGPWSSNANNQIAWNRTYTIWSGNWLNWYNSGGTVSKTRIQVVREVTDNLLQDLNGVNVGLMHFNDNQGGTVAHAMENIGTSRAAMQTAVNALTADNLDAAVGDPVRGRQLLHGPQCGLRQCRARAAAWPHPAPATRSTVRHTRSRPRMPARRTTSCCSPTACRRRTSAPRPRSRRCLTGPPT